MGISGFHSALAWGLSHGAPPLPPTARVGQCEAVYAPCPLLGVGTLLGAACGVFPTVLRGNHEEARHKPKGEIRLRRRSLAENTRKTVLKPYVENGVRRRAPQASV